jgi:hypothetical protein
MIIRQSIIDGNQWVFLQVEHAYGSGDAFDFIRSDFFDSEFTAELREVTRLHDEGWKDYDQSFVDGALNQLIHFPDVDNSSHSTIWKKSIQIMENQGNFYGAACLCDHASALSDEKPDLQEYLHAERIRIIKRAFPQESPEVRNWRVERGFLTLRFADLMTLMPCSGWDGPIPSKLIDPEGRSFDFEFTEPEPWTIAIDPWPLKKKHHELIMDGFCFPEEIFKSGEALNWDDYRATCRLRFIPKS